MFSIKDLRRIETELADEASHVIRRIQGLRRKSAPTKSMAVKECVAEIEELRESSLNLIAARYKVRRIISDFNVSKGINEKTLRMAELEAQADLLSGTILQVSHSLITSSVYGSDKDTTYSYGIDDEYEDCIRADIRGIKREIARLKDSCNGINASSKFEIPEDLLTLIKKYGLIDN